MTRISRMMLVGAALLVALVFGNVVLASSHTASLSNLELTGSSGNTITLSPGFSSSVTSYTASARSDDATTSITATAADDGAVTVQDADGVVIASLSAVPLRSGSNAFNIVVKDGATTRTYRLTVTKASASDATLKTLSLSNGLKLSPAFSPNVTSYTVSAPYDFAATDGIQNTSTVTATPTDGAATATVSAPSENQYGVGVTSVPVTVRSADGTASKVYTIAITRAGNAKLSNLTLGDDVTLSPGFKAGTTSYTASVPYNTNSVAVTATVAAQPATDATVKISGTAATSGTATTVSLDSGANPIRVEVKSGTATETYTVTVTRASATYASLKSLSLADPAGTTVRPAFSRGTTSYSVTVPSNTTSVTLVSDLGDENVTVQVNGADPAAVTLTKSPQAIEVKATRSGATARTYRLTVTKASKSDATLKTLSLSNGLKLSPAFSPNVTSYTVSAPYDFAATDGIQNTSTVTATPTDGAATATVSAPSENQYGVGVTSVPVTVRSADGTASKSYTVVITRAGNAKLSNLTLGDDVTLSPGFKAGTTSYTASVPYSTASVNVTATVAAQPATDAKVTVLANGKKVTGDTLTANLKPGANTISVMVTSGGESMTYTVEVMRGAADAALSELKLSGIKPFGFTAATTSYGSGDNLITVPSTVASTTVSAKGVPGATIALPGTNGQVTLKDGANTIKVAVTSPDGSTKTTYTVIVTREGGALTALALTVSSDGSNDGDKITLNPVFKSGITSYAASVGNAIGEIEVAATAAATGTAVITPADADDGDDGHQVALKPGANTIKVVVTPADGTAPTTYTVSVFRVHLRAQLTALSLGDGVALKPKFNAGTTTYEASVSHETAQVTVSGTPSQNASIAVTPGDADAETDGHQVALTEGANTITVNVSHGTGGSAVTTPYTVTVTRAAAPEVVEDRVPVFSPASGSVKLAAGGGDVSHQVPAATGGDGNLVYTSNAAAPLSFNAATRIVSGTVTASATVVVTATDEDGDQASYTLVISVPQVETVQVPGPTVTQTRTVTRTVTETVEVPVPPNVIGGTMQAMATEVDGRVLITRHDGGPSLAVDIGGFIRDESLGQTYQIVRRMDGMIVRQWVSPNSPLVYQIPWSVVNTQFTVPVGVIMAIPLDDQSGSEGQLVRRFDGSGDDRIFSYAMGVWRHVPDIPTFQALGYYWCDVTAADSEFFNRISIGPAHAPSMQPASSDYPNCSTG